MKKITLGSPQLPGEIFTPRISYPNLKMTLISIFNGWLIRKSKKSGGYWDFFLKIWPSNVFSQVKSTQKPGIWVKMAYLGYQFEKFLIQIYPKSSGNPLFWGDFLINYLSNWKLI